MSRCDTRTFTDTNTAARQWSDVVGRTFERSSRSFVGGARAIRNEGTAGSEQ